MDDGTGVSGQFQVDLRGLVDLLSHHLYTSPRVFVRELMQNGVDAIVQASDAAIAPSARKRWRLGREQSAPTVIEMWGSDASRDGRFHCFDRGVGLDATDLRTFLSTIGRSSKRDELGLARSDLLGQFGIGLLSCFMVSDSIEVVSRKCDGALTGWIGHADGTYEVHSDVLLAPDDPRRKWLDSGAGTCVSLTPQSAADNWLIGDRVADLAAYYGAALPHRIVVHTVGGERTVAPQAPPWTWTDARERLVQCQQYVRNHWNVEPLAVLPMSVPAVGLEGFAAVLPGPSHVGHEQPHTVYLKGMLLSDQVRDLTPEWAFFVRCVVDVEALHPTASREALYDDELLAAVRDSIGDQLKRWLKHLGRTNPQQFGVFLRQHDTALKAMALHDDDLLSIVLPILPFETNQGVSTLRDLAATTDHVHYCTGLDEYRQLSVVARAQGMAVINACYVYEADLLARATKEIAGVRVSPLDPLTFDAHIREVASERLSYVHPQLNHVRHVLDGLEVDVELREYKPATLASLLLHDVDARRRAQSRAVQEQVDDVWSSVLAALDDGGIARPKLLLNDSNRVVRKLLGGTDPSRTRMVAEALYARALLASGSPMRPADIAVVDNAFTSLTDLAFPE